jgi:hypothetical protein
LLGSKAGFPTQLDGGGMFCCKIISKYESNTELIRDACKLFGIPCGSPYQIEGVHPSRQVMIVLAIAIPFHKLIQGQDST